ncbi:hypothetical protein D3C73_1503360 [compost metagenome]
MLIQPCGAKGVKCTLSIRGSAAAKENTNTAMIAITTAICTFPATCIPIQFVTRPAPSMAAARAILALSPQPIAAVM